MKKKHSAEFASVAIAATVVEATMSEQVSM
jgi:hypothetical protein